MSPKATRPSALKGITIAKHSHCGKIFITVTFTSSNEPSELFIRFGKAGGCGSAIGDAVARLVSYGLRSGMDVEDAIKAVEGIGCHHGQNTCMNMVAEAIADAMEEMRA